MEDPEEHILWALVNMAGAAGAPLLMPEPVMRSWARHLWDCGFRHHPELQMLFYRPPRAGASVLEAGAGEWVAADEPGVNPVPPAAEDPIDRLLDRLSPDQRAELARRAAGGDDA